MIESDGFLKFRADGIKFEIDLNTGSPGIRLTPEGHEIRLPGLQGFLLLKADHLSYCVGALQIECRLPAEQGKRLLELLKG